MRCEESGLIYRTRHFKKYLEQNSEKNLGTPRHRACIAVVQAHVDRVLKKGPKPEKFDYAGIGWVDLVSVDAKEGYVGVGLSYLLPRVYSLLDALGWHIIDVGTEDVYAY